LHYIRERGLMRAGDRVAVAVSGGADSVALLRVLLELQAELGIVLAVAHFNHRLRGADSEADEAFVADLARQQGLEFLAGRADVRQHALAGKLSIEAAGRKLRYGWLTRLADGQRFDSIATAHTLDDQAETVLLKFLRGAGTRGLAGIYPSLEIGRTNGFPISVGDANWQNPSRAAAAGSEPRSGNHVRIVRPLLCVTRDEVEAYLTSLGQSWREDESNLDHRFARNRVRHVLLPLLECEYNPNIRQVLSETAELARAEEEYWQALVERELEARQRTKPAEILPGLKPGTPAASDGAAEAVPLQTSAAERRLSLASFQALPLALQRRLLRRFAESEDLALDFEHVEKLLLCAHGGRAKTELPRGWLAVRRGECLELRAPQPEPAGAGYEYNLRVPGEVLIAEIGLTLRAMVVPEEFAHESGATDTLLSAELLGPELTVRNWRPGDRFWPVHSGSEEKLKRLFWEQHIPAEQRPSWPVVLKGEQIVWVRGFPTARAYAWGGKGDAVSIEGVG
ncbi:MAG TPA: tRNA lysidine(34) synthetase TilS, partial [Terriglobales bacterium]|nr:tRNA lysidine(34) synthetase TilS [Terriglobales bacterium]